MRTPRLGALRLAAAWALCGALAARGTERPVNREFTTRSEVIAPHGIACASQPLAAQAAVDILKRGGSAVDAAIAADACLGLMEPTSCGIGGDLFALVWDGQKLHALNGSGRSPYGLTLEMLHQRGLTNLPPFGPLPVTVPGCVDGWFALHSKFGRLPMATNLAPAIGYARDGFPVSEVIAYDWERNARRLQEYPNFRDTFMPGGHAPRKGERFRNALLANTLTTVAEGGRDAFYKGAIARRIAGFLQAQGGFLSERDLAEHHSDWVEPISTNYRGYDVWEIPPNGQGLSVLQLLNVIEGYEPAKMGWGSATWMHTFIEAKKLVYEDRARLYGDPEFVQPPVERLLSKSYAAERRALIRTNAAARRYDPGVPALRAGDTIYLTVADERGMMVSFIQSNYRGMGSGMVPDGLGFGLHDRGEAFDLTAGRPNSYAPHKRPFHTIIPAFVTREGRPFLSFGVMGGDMQPQGQVQVLVNLIDFGMNLQEAGDAPRVYHTGSSDPDGTVMSDGGTVYLEDGFPATSARELAAIGHKVSRTMVEAFGGYQAIQWDETNRVWIGASESRKDGAAIGY